jgi:hypothetical protein
MYKNFIKVTIFLQNVRQGQNWIGSLPLRTLCLYLTFAHSEILYKCRPEELECRESQAVLVEHTALQLSTHSWQKLALECSVEHSSGLALRFGSFHIERPCHILLTVQHNHLQVVDIHWMEVDKVSRLFGRLELGWSCHNSLAAVHIFLIGSLLASALHPGSHQREMLPLQFRCSSLALVQQHSRSLNRN